MFPCGLWQVSLHRGDDPEVVTIMTLHGGQFGFSLIAPHAPTQCAEEATSGFGT